MEYNMVESDWIKYTYKSCLTCKHTLINPSEEPCRKCYNNNAGKYLKWESQEGEVRNCETCKNQPTPYYMQPCTSCRGRGIHERHTKWEKR